MCSSVCVTSAESLKMIPAIWKTADNGKFEIVSLTKDRLEDALHVIRAAFFVDENVSKAVELDKHPEAAEELIGLSMRAANDGCSLIAVEKETGNIVAVALNKLQVPAKPEDLNFFETYASNCKQPSAKALIQFMVDMDNEYNLFEKCQIDCLLEIMFIATLREYRQRGIAKKLCEAVVDVASKLLSGINVRVSVTDEDLPLVAPKVVADIGTSNATQKISRALGFKTAIEISFDRWSFNGKKFSERIGPDTPVTTLDYKKLL